VASDRLWNEPLLSLIEKDRHEFRGPTFGMINHLCDELSFPIDSFAFARLLMASEAPVVRLCANGQNKIGPVKAVEHPAGPSFFRGSSNVLIDLGVHPILTETLGQL
jgi:hypothetical protein